MWRNYFTNHVLTYRTNGNVASKYDTAVQQRNGKTPTEHPEELNTQLPLYKVISETRAEAEEIETRNEGSNPEPEDPYTAH
jgi:hypothetical protein